MKTERSIDPTACGGESQSIAEEASGHAGKRAIGRRKRSSKASRRIEENNAFSEPTAIHGEFECDRRFLNDVIQRVHLAISAGDLELKTEHAFKAIEIKQKISENSHVENLLLELLNEIRRQELGRPTDGPHSDESPQ